MTASSKTPTASSISRLLSGAGFTRAVVAKRGGCSGFIVRKCYSRDDAVRVRHHVWTMAGDDRRLRAALAKYAKTLTKAGFAVEAGEYELIVTAKAED